MNKLIAFSVISMAFSFAAQAEVLPAVAGGGYILESACGNLNRSMELCLAKASKSGQNYIVLKDGLRRSVAYIPVSASALNPGIVGSSRTLYRGVYATFLEARNGKMAIETQLEVTTSRVIYPNAPTTANVVINGVQQSSSFELHPVVRAL